jgi:hypothetical protein
MDLSKLSREKQDLVHDAVAAGYGTERWESRVEVVRRAKHGTRRVLSGLCLWESGRAIDLSLDPAVAKATTSVEDMRAMLGLELVAEAEIASALIARGEDLTAERIKAVFDARPVTALPQKGREALLAELVERAVERGEHLATMREYLQVRHGEHPAWGGLGDSVANADSFLQKIGMNDPVRAEALAQELRRQPLVFADAMGVLVERIPSYVNRLEEGLRMGTAPKGNVAAIVASVAPAAESAWNWTRDEHDSQKLHLADASGRHVASIWKSGSRWGALTGETFSTQREAREAMESHARQWLHTEQEEVQSRQEVTAPGVDVGGHGETYLYTFPVIERRIGATPTGREGWSWVTHGLPVGHRGAGNKYEVLADYKEVRRAAGFEIVAYDMSQAYSRIGYLPKPKVIVSQREVSAIDPKLQRLAFVQEWSDELVDHFLSACRAKGYDEEMIFSVAQRAAESLNLDGIRGGDSSLVHAAADLLGFDSGEALLEFTRTYPDLATKHGAGPALSSCEGVVIGVSLTTVVFEVADGGRFGAERTRFPNGAVELGDQLVADRFGSVRKLAKTEPAPVSTTESLSPNM